MKKQKGLREIPGVGPSIERDLQGLGFHTVEALRGQDPEELYFRGNLRKGVTQDRCLLYVYRLAVYLPRAGASRKS